MFQWLVSKYSQIPRAFESEMDNLVVDVDIPYNQLKIDQKIGEGNYGQVLRGCKLWNIFSYFLIIIESRVE